MANKDNERLYAIINDAAYLRYHELYQMLGERKGDKNQNFHCWNGQGHSDGEDSNASLSISNETGQYLCHGCGIKGNFTTYYKTFIAGGPHDKWDGHFTKFAVDILNLKHHIPDDKVDDEEYLAQAIEISRHIDEIVKPQRYQVPEREQPKKKQFKPIPTEVNDEFVNTLLKKDDIRKYLGETRFITDAIITKYRIGYDSKNNCITFPMIDARGTITNIKMYRPWKPDFKWQIFVAGNPIIPSPIVHLTHTKIYIFEGEPDTYCAAAHGFYGITSGSASNTNLHKIYGDQFDNIFRNKEIVIVMDADDKGVLAAEKLAKDLYGVVKQIKILDLNKSENNPFGLDPKLTKKVGEKDKRTEKDFTDFMKKNGFGEKAITIFKRLEETTGVYTQNVSRTSRENFKVTLTESVNSKYYDPESRKHLELIATVQDLYPAVYKYPTKVCTICKPIADINYKTGFCKKCRLSATPGFGDGSATSLIFDFKRFSSIDDKSKLTKNDIPVSEYDLIAMIQTTDEKRIKMKKRILDIPEGCKDVKIDELELQSIQHVNLAKDPDDLIDDEAKSTKGNGDKTVEAYFMGEKIASQGLIDMNKSYRLKAIQTRSPSKQTTVLFAYDVMPQENSFDQFVMNRDIFEMLQVFRPIESLEQHLKDRYKIFGNAAGINGREDLFFLCDLAYFSAVELRNDQVLPSINRGWVEILISGDPRCGKSIVGEFLFDHYRVGEFIGSSKTVALTGLIGGISTTFGQTKINWGKFPQNDRGIVTIDELSHIAPEDLHAMNYLRSSGMAEIEKIIRGKTFARCRKIFFSNWRGKREEDINTSLLGIELIRELCMHDADLARFDVATIVKSGDVKSFDCQYEKITSKFTSFQCRNLIFWAYSRRPDQIKFEDGFSDALNEGQIKLLEKFHSSTQLVNQEMRAKLCRCAISLATMTFSTDKDDWNIIYVTKDHVRYMVDFLMKLYSHKNMGMIEFTESKRRQEDLGDMKFMMNILEYVDIDSVLDFKEGMERDICCIFSDYLLQVTRGEMFIVDGKSDRRTTGWRAHEANDKFIGLLRARNCITRSFRNRYKKTEVFTEWLQKRKAAGREAPRSNILDNRSPEPLSADALMSTASKKNT